jgi:hypothetical protein
MPDMPPSFPNLVYDNHFYSLKLAAPATQIFVFLLMKCVRKVLILTYRQPARIHFVISPAQPNRAATVPRRAALVTRN